MTGTNICETDASAISSHTASHGLPPSPCTHVLFATRPTTRSPIPASPYPLLNTEHHLPSAIPSSPASHPPPPKTVLSHIFPPPLTACTPGLGSLFQVFSTPKGRFSALYSMGSSLCFKRIKKYLCFFLRRRRVLLTPRRGRKKKKLHHITLTPNSSEGRKKKKKEEEEEEPQVSVSLRQPPPPF